ncbi:MarR family winged helix-turn-helix transcriptional regulator [Stutzerimonas kirkiae]|uniref:MarR family transcriptional regulator n=1 Tax=Stutzerimonas kirkiae TaxID=2211392 RepID=A0A4Q9RFD9_9GAMM|nr:MarR family transcriptional regulator [Stutzerimonas kirkiae]TBU99203.1 MarR family transcriptional regulator [Stutzerimonas kirkiae]TBV06337.1 MarR family transcriptional regulator [Stutzerimonas kirkiae]TBV07531.1 MarR family transcriptional regulator [Stutzerimonas kirkiae]TBV15772.1 MarR family transcriptional regulator [Stutzerimonas kirkiae]
MHTRNLADPLQQLTHAYKSHIRRAIQQAGIALPITHVRTLKFIGHTRDCTAQTLTQHMRRDKAQITRALNDLLAGGLIVKRDNPQDRRSQYLHLSAQGEALMQRLQVLESEAAQRMSEGLTNEQLENFIQLARQMANNLNT